MKCRNGRCRVNYNVNRRTAKFIAAVILTAAVILVAVGNMLTERLMNPPAAENTAIYSAAEETA